MQKNFNLELFRLGKEASIYGLSSAISRMVSIFMAPILTRMFAPADYGVIALVQLAIGFFVVIAGMNLGSGMSYYYFRQEDELHRKSVLTTGVVSIGVLSAVISGLLFFFANEVASILQIRSEGSIVGHDLPSYLKIAALGLFFSLMGTGFTNILRLVRQPVKFMQVELSNVFVNFAAVLILVVWLNQGLEGVFWAGVVASFVRFAVGFLFVFSRFGQRLSFVTLGLILAYSMPQLPGVFLNWSQTQLGRVFLNYYVSLTDLGLYTIAFMVASVLSLITTAFRMAYDPYALSIMKEENVEKTYAKVYGIYAVAICCLVGIIGALAKPVLMILTPPEYHDAHRIVIYFLVAMLYMGMNNILATGIWLSKRTIFTSYAQFISFSVLIAANLLFVPMFGAIGAAFAFLCGMVSQSFAYYYFAQRLRPIPYQYKKVSALILLVFVIGIMHSELVSQENLINSIGIAFITIIIIVGLCWTIGVTAPVKQQIRSWLRVRCHSITWR